MGALWSQFFKKRDPKTPIKGIGPRLKNIIVQHHRGILGSLVPLIALPALLKKGDHKLTVMAMWMWMFWFFLVQPVNIPVTGLIPIFVLPMAGVMASEDTCACYMNEGIAMFILGNMVLLLWNNSGLDRRIMLWFLCSGDTSQFSGKRLVFKCCIAAFFLSMFSNKLIVTNIMIQYITPIMTSLQSTAVKGTDPDYNEMRYIINNAIHTSCSIGGIAIIHSSYATLTFRTIFQTTLLAKDTTWHDIFNYLEYTVFALPVAIVMLILNCGYNILLIHVKTAKAMSVASLTKVRTTLLNHKKDIPKNVTLHEKTTLFFSILSLFVYFFRWTRYFDGWAKQFDVYHSVPGVRDATVAALFVIALHSLPSGFRFIKIWTAKKKSQFGTAKPESGILWWRFVDKNITYGYLFLIGSGVALSVSALHSKLNLQIAQGSFGKIFNSQDKIVYILLVCIVAVILTNIMSSVAAVVIFLPFVMNLYARTPVAATEGGDAGGTPGEGGGLLRTETSAPQIAIGDVEKIYLGALAVGLAGSFGFTCPFLYTPAYFCHHTGKVPKKKMVKYGVGSAIICCLILWVFISFYAPVLWPTDNIQQVPARTTTTTTKETTAAPDAF